MNAKQTDEARSEQDRLLDEALEETFPASDPITMQQTIIVGRAERPSSPSPAKATAVARDPSDRFNNEFEPS